MSYRILIADDEPLVLIGLRELIDWQQEGFEIIAQARNGKALLEDIEKLSPDLVITDIKMPIASGMEVLERIKEEKRELPLFIFLTSFEEFSLVKQAIGLDAIDYLVKLELEPEQLKAALRRAKKKIEEIKGSSEGSTFNEMKMLQEQFLMRKLFSIEQAAFTPDEIGLNMNQDDSFSVAYVTIPSLLELGKDQMISLYSSACHLIKETAERYIPCHIVQLDIAYIAVIIPFREESRSGYRSYLHSAFKASFESLKNYLSLEAFAYCGPLVDNINLLSESFAKAKLVAREDTKKSSHIVFYDHAHDISEEKLILDTALITKAFEELDGVLLESEIMKAVEEMKSKAISRVLAMDAASTMLYMAINLAPEAESSLMRIFRDSRNPYSYRSLYQACNTDEIAQWLTKFAAGFRQIFNEKKQDYRMQTVQRIQTYIDENVSEKLTLTSVASIFGYSQGYLSSLFSRYASISFVDYVNNAKIKKAKQLLSDPNAMIYEVATSLGFESQFYFSKVFKKITGVSPSTYQNSHRS